MSKMIGGLFAVLGFLLILGSAGSDCDGACMERALSLTQIIAFTLGGFCCIIIGIILMKGNDYE